LPVEWRRRVRGDGRALIKGSKSFKKKFFEDEFIDAFLKQWRTYPPEWSEAAFRELLRFLIAMGREGGGFTLTLEGCSERLSTLVPPYGQIIVDAFMTEAAEHFEDDCAEKGVQWFESYFPVLPEGRHFADQAARTLFRKCLEIYCKQRRMK